MLTSRAALAVNMQLLLDMFSAVTKGVGIATPLNSLLSRATYPPSPARKSIQQFKCQLAANLVSCIQNLLPKQRPAEDTALN